MDVFTPDGVATLYIFAGMAAGAVSGVVAFFGVWIWAARRYDLLGFLFGWIPSGVAAMALYYLMILLWLPAVGVWIWSASRNATGRRYSIR